MQHWDKLGLTWNATDVLGCILPNKADETVVVNARRFLIRPIEHWNTVHTQKVCLDVLYTQNLKNLHSYL